MKSIKLMIYEYTLDALNFYGGDRNKVSANLQISDRTLRNYIKEIKKIPELKARLDWITKKTDIKVGLQSKCHIFPTNEERIAYSDNYPNRYAAS